jgi:4-carboxymuconolactone decarboxylase
MMRIEASSTAEEEQPMSRLSIMDRSALPLSERRFYDAVKWIRRRPISGPFIVLLNACPDLAARFARLGHYFHSRGQADESVLSMRVRTFMALVGSRALDAPYEWSAWLGWGLEAGVPQATVDAIRTRAPLTQLSAEDTLVLEFCAQLAGGEHHVDDALFERARVHFGVRGVTELAACLGYFAMIAFPLNAFEMEMSAEQKKGRKPFAPLTFEPHSTAWKEGAGSPWPAQSSARSATRLPEIREHAQMKPEEQHFLDRLVRTRGRIAPPYHLLLNSPDAAERVADVGDYFLYETKLAPLARALTWLVTARELDSKLAWTAGLNFARSAGLAPTQIAALEQRASLDAFDAQARCLIEFCYRLLRGNHHVDDAAYAQAVQSFGVPTLVEVSATVGYVAMMAIITNAFGLEASAEDEELVL